MYNSRQTDIMPFASRLWLSSPTMHGDEMEYVAEAYEANWMSTAGTNINEIEKLIAGKAGCGYGAALSSGTAALHLAVKLAGEKLYGIPENGRGSLNGHKVFCSDLTFAATVNPVVYEGGIPVFIDAERDTWNMDPGALERAFEIYPEVRLVVLAHLYGTPAKMDEIERVAHSHGALIVEDAAESLGAAYKGRQTGSFGSFSCISFNGNKIICGCSGGMFLSDSAEDTGRVRKWSTQSRENASWYQHEEIGYNYRMNNVVAGVIRGQIPYLEEHICKKKAVYERYRDGLKGLQVSMNPYDAENSDPNFWLSCLLVNEGAMCRQTRNGIESIYTSERGKSCPAEILEALDSINAEGRPVWKPMHMQPFYRMNPFVAVHGNADVGMDIFNRGLCLPSDIKMSREQQDVVIEVIHRCFA